MNQLEHSYEDVRNTFVSKYSSVADSQSEVGLRTRRQVQVGPTGLVAISWRIVRRELIQFPSVSIAHTPFLNHIENRKVKRHFYKYIVRNIESTLLTIAALKEKSSFILLLLSAHSIQLRQAWLIQPVAFSV